MKLWQVNSSSQKNKRAYKMRSDKSIIAVKLRLMLLSFRTTQNTQHGENTVETVRLRMVNSLNLME